MRTLMFVTEEPAQPPIQLNLLGAPVVSVRGAPLEVDTRKAVALLAYLAVSGRPQSRERLAELLYPDYDTERGRAALRRTLSSLRRGLGDTGLRTSRQAVELDVTDVRVDVASFRSLLRSYRSHEHQAGCEACVALLEEAVELYRGDFLSGFSLRDSPSFDDWMLGEGEALRVEFQGALDALIDLLIGSGRLERALDRAQRRLGLDPLSEPTHRTIMRLHAARGERSAAVAQYRECVAVLETELGVPPLEETTALYDQITEGRFEQVVQDRFAPPATATAPVAPAPAHRLPLVGRGAEEEALWRTYERGAGVVIVQGEAGIGKTRLCEEFVDRVRTQGARVLTARAHEGERDIAYALVLQLLGSVGADGGSQGGVQDAWVAEAARIHPELSRGRDLPAPASLEEAGARVRFLEGVSQVLWAALRSDARGVLLTEDLQWCDAASLEVLAYFARRVAERDVTMLGTWRTEDPDAVEHLRDHLPKPVLVVEPGRLTRGEIEQLVSDVVAPDKGEELAHRLFEETEGLPFFVVEYLESIGRESRSPAEWLLPAGVKQLLERRVAGVSGAAGQLLGAAAVFGRSFDFEVVLKASGREELEALTALEELLAHHLIEALDRDGIYDFTHAKLRTFVYESMTPARRRLLHRRAAELLERHAHGDASVARSGEIADHLEAAGDLERAAERHWQAGQEARRLFAHEDALRRFRRALSLGHGDAASIHEAIGDVETDLGRYRTAVASYETAAALGSADAVWRLERKLGNVHERRGDLDLAESHLSAALDLAPPTPSSAPGGIMADLSLVAHRRGERERGRDLAEQALAHAVAAGDDEAVARAHNILGIIASANGDAAAARRHLEQSLLASAALDDARPRIAALNNLALVARGAGDLALALDLTQTALELCSRRGDRHREAALHGNLADLLRATGDISGAMGHLKYAAAMFTEVGEEPGGMLPEVWKLVEW